jgi:hypothetical protein
VTYSSLTMIIFCLESRIKDGSFASVLGVYLILLESGLGLMLQV